MFTTPDLASLCIGTGTGTGGTGIGIGGIGIGGTGTGSGGPVGIPPLSELVRTSSLQLSHQELVYECSHLLVIASLDANTQITCV